jgi:hypothetical protein
MARRAVLAAAAGWLLISTGCPHAFGKGGTIDRAAHQDEKTFQQSLSGHPRLEAREDEEDEERICPDDMVQHEDCRQGPPCKVTCKPR